VFIIIFSLFKKRIKAAKKITINAKVRREGSVNRFVQTKTKSLFNPSGLKRITIEEILP